MLLNQIDVLSSAANSAAMAQSSNSFYILFLALFALSIVVIYLARKVNTLQKEQIESMQSTFEANIRSINETNKTIIAEKDRQIQANSEMIEKLLNAISSFQNEIKTLTDVVRSHITKS